MSKKFTEEQYQKILDIGNKDKGIGIGWIIGNPLFVYLDSIGRSGDLNIASLFLILESREWAHDKFVEQEKKYYWTSKGEDSKGLKRRLYIKADRVRDYFEDEFLYNENEALTEQQVYQWGYNPDMFDKEDAQ